MWQSIVKKLQARGYTQAQIGRLVGLSQPAISNMAAGSYRHGPRGDSALKLVKLAGRATKRGKR